MSLKSTSTDLRYDVLITAAIACRDISDKFESLNLFSDISPETHISKSIEFSKDIARDLEAFKCLRGSAYEDLVNQSDKAEMITSMRDTLDQCVDDPCQYDKALNILEYLDQLSKDSETSGVSLIANICKDIKSYRSHLLFNLCNSLDNQKDTSTNELKKIVYQLTKCGQFSDRDLRLRFLQSRDYWFNSECENKSESFDELITFFCNGLPKIFEEFKSIFGDASTQGLDRLSGVIPKKSTEEDGAIINSWLLLKTSTFILSLEMHLRSLGKSRLLTPTMISDTMEKCFKLTNWLASIGFDFGSRLRPLFSRIIIDEFKLNVERATNKFETGFTNIVAKSIESLLLPIDDEILRVSNMKPEEQVPKSIEHYTVFKIYCLHIIDAMRWIRATQSLMSPISLCVDVYAALNASLSRVMQAIAVILNTDNNSSHPILSKVSVLLITEILPFLSKYCELVFPEKIVLGAIGLTKTEFKLLSAKNPDKLRNLSLSPPFLEKFQRHIANRAMINI